jgi:hypothetical protein
VTADNRPFPPRPQIPARPKKKKKRREEINLRQFLFWTKKFLFFFKKIGKFFYGNQISFYWKFLPNILYPKIEKKNLRNLRRKIEIF